MSLNSINRFVGADDANSRAPFYVWLRNTVPAENITFRITDEHGILNAVCAGAGLGFLHERLAADRPDLVQVLPPREDYLELMRQHGLPVKNRDSL